MIESHKCICTYTNSNFEEGKTYWYESIKNSVKQKEEIKIQVNLLDDEEVIKDYRIQLDIKVSRKKAREIENYLRETLERMI